MLKYIFALAPLVFASAIASAGMPSAQTTTFPAEAISSVSIDIDFGKISVEGASTDTITVEQFQDNEKIGTATVKRSGSKLKLKFRMKPGNHNNPETGFKVIMPKNLALSAKIDSGSVEMRDISSTLDIKAATGNVKLDRLSGALTLNMDTGLAQLAWAALPKTGKIEITSDTGLVTLCFPADAKIKAKLNTDSGKIDNAFQTTEGFPVSVKTDSGLILLKKN